MNKTLSILFSGALFCAFSAESCATNQVTSDPVQIAIKALNLPGYEGYEQGKKPQLCILCANPTQKRWKEKSKELSKNYDLTFIDLGEDGVGMASDRRFDDVMEEMGYELLDCYESPSNLPLSSCKAEGASESDLKSYARMCGSAFRYETKMYLGKYKKTGSNTVVIRCNLTSKVFQEYARKYLVDKFDAIVQDITSVDVCTLPEETMVSLMASLKNNGVFLSSDYSSDSLSDEYEKVLWHVNVMKSQINYAKQKNDAEQEKKFVYELKEIEKDLRTNPWISVINELPSYSPWKRSEKNGVWNINSEKQNFNLPIDNAFVKSWKVRANCAAICKIDGDLAKHLIGAILIGNDFYQPYTRQRVMIAKFDPESNSSGTNSNHQLCNDASI